MMSSKKATVVSCRKKLVPTVNTGFFNLHDTQVALYLEQQQSRDAPTCVLFKVLKIPHKALIGEAKVRVDGKKRLMSFSRER